jgi:antitoxin HicB
MDANARLKGNQKRHDAGNTQTVRDKGEAVKPIAYAVRLTPDKKDGGFVVDFPGLGGFTQGDTREEALLNASGLLESIIADRIKHNEDIPSPAAHKKTQPVALPPMAAAKLFLYWEMKRQKISKASLIKRLHCHWPQMDRLLDIRHESKFSQIETAFAALGKRLVVSVSDAR